MKVGNKLREIRQSRNETLHNVAMGTNIDMTLISKFERGERLPTKEQVLRIAGHFGIDGGKLAAEATAEKIITEYGNNEITYNAADMVREATKPYGAET